jgi:3-hydroxy acid dehydrogenase / malonic semialdehyde reductase
VAPLSGRTVLITGASSGIGEACARTLAANGARLVLNARRVEKLKTLARRLEAEFGSKVRVCPFDVRKPQAIRRALARLPPEWRAVDVLINNAGLARGWEKIYEGDPEEWDEVIDSNLKGLLYVTRMILPGMVQRRRGHVVNIASISGIETYANDAVYSASKAAVRSLTESMKKDLLGTPVRVTAVSPGVVRTGFFEVRYHGDRERAAAVFEGFAPLDPEDVADAVLFAVTRRPRVNVNEIVMMSVDQAGPIMTKASEGDA